MKGDQMRTPLEVKSTQASVSYDAAQLQRAVSHHLAVTAVEWLGHEVDVINDGDTVDVALNDEPVPMGIRYLAMTGCYIDLVVLDDSPSDSPRWRAVVIRRRTGDLIARQAYYSYPSLSAITEADEWEYPPLASFL